MPERPSDEAFAQHLLISGMATPEQVQGAMRQQALVSAFSTPHSLAETLVGQGVITRTQKEAVEQKLGSSNERVSRLGPYKLKRKIGEGGMGTVYLARDTRDRRLVAVKVLSRVQARSPDALRRFQNEVEAALQLDHPNIARAFIFGEDKGYRYYVMEYCEGEPLHRRLTREKFFPVEEAVDIAAQAARALDYAHQRGFIHRDIKPENIILNPDGTVKLLDLGLSKNMYEEDASALTVSGVAMGTPHYLSPEQARADRDMDGRTDIYSLGATLYHLVTGDTPFHGSCAFDIITKHLTERLRDPRDIREGIPDDLVHIIRRMMAKERKDRYRDCGELLADLERIIRGDAPASQILERDLSTIAEPVRVLPRSSAPRRPLAMARRAPPRRTSNAALWLIGTAAAAFVGGVIAVAFATKAGPRAVPAPAVAETQQARRPAEAARPPQAPATRLPTPRDLREEDARRRLEELRGLERKGLLSPMELSHRTARLADEFKETPTGRDLQVRLAAQPLPEETPAPPDPAAPAAAEPAPAPPPAPEAAPTPRPEPEPAIAAQVPVRPRVALPGGLLGHWRLDDSPADASGRAQAATPVREPRWGPGKIGGALVLDGRGAHATVPDSEALRLTGDLTIAFWMRKDAESGDWVRIVGKGDERIRNFGVWEESGAGKRHLFQQYHSGGAAVLNFESRAHVEVGAWTHVAAVVEGNVGALYVNGEKDSERARTGVPGTSAAPLTFGYAGHHAPFQGALDDIRLYARALGAEEVRALYEARAGDLARAAPPDAARIKDAEVRVRERFKLDPSRVPAGEREALARKLLRYGIEAAGDPAAQYVLLRDAGELAVQAGSFTAAIESVDALAELFDVNPFALKLSALGRIRPPARDPEFSRALAEAYCRLADQAAGAGDFESAAAAAAKAEPLADSARSAELAARARDLRRDAGALRAEALKARDAIEKPGTGDPEAAGRFLCFARGDWEQGLPFLVRARASPLKTLAEKDLAGASDAVRQTEIGDGWWDLAASEKNSWKKGRMLARAQVWYQLAFPYLAGLERVRIEKRLEGPKEPAARRSAAPEDPRTDASRVEESIRKAAAYLRSKAAELVPFAHAGVTAHHDELVLWALLHAKVAWNEPTFQALFKGMMGRDLEVTYGVSLQAMILEEIDPVRFQWRIQQCAQFLADNQCPNGSWGYGAPTVYARMVAAGESRLEAAGPDPAKSRKIARKVSVKKMKDGTGEGDHSNAAYAALGIRAAHDAGLLFETALLQRALQSWKDSQKTEKSGKEAAGGWCYAAHPGHPSYGSMTASGLGCLAIYGSILDANRTLAWRREKALDAGQGWMGRNFSVMYNPGPYEHAGMAVNSQNQYYYFIYALERVGRLLNVEGFGGRSWYPEGVQALLGAQRPDGSWNGNVPDTCFSVLFLTRATRPLEGPPAGR